MFQNPAESRGQHVSRPPITLKQNTLSTVINTIAKPKPMKLTLALGIALLTAGSVFAAETNSTDSVKTALAGLKAATNYSWTATIKIPNAPFEPGPVKGRTEQGGYSMV